MVLSGQLHAPAPLLPGRKRPSCTRLGGPHSRSGRSGEDKNRLYLPEIDHRFLGRPVRSLLANRLNYCGSEFDVASVEKLFPRFLSLKDLA
jgi:hypothetical protein